MNSKIVCNWDDHIKSACILFINQYGKLTLSKILKKYLSDNKAYLYCDAVKIEPSQTSEFLSGIAPMKILTTNNFFYIMTIEGKIVYIIYDRVEEYAESLKIMNYLKMITTVPKIIDIYIINNILSILTSTNILYHLNKFDSIESFTELVFEKEIKFIKNNEDIIIILFEDSSFLMYDVHAENFKESSSHSNKIILDAHFQKEYCLYLYSDFSMHVESTGASYNLSLSVISEHADKYYVEIVNDFNMDAPTYTIYKYGKIVSNVDGLRIRSESKIFYIKKTEHFESLSVYTNDLSKYIINIMKTLDCESVILTAHFLIIIMTDNSFKFYDYNVKFNDEDDIIHSELFDEIDGGCFLLDDGNGGYI